ncbi:hypothetical protein GOV08_04530, partial [Candidatus Woesearchaeota archaeon]|nr:hypothetical protein [Candidatus Woesearchaeota archaeon]
MFGAYKNKKKGIFFTADALFGALIIVTALVFFSQNFIQEEKIPDLSYMSYDVVKGFSVIKTSELNNSYLKQLIQDGVVNNTNQTILETIGELYVLNKTTEAQNLAENISAQLIPSRYGFSIVVNEEEVYSNALPVTKTLFTSKRLISGIEKFKPIRGSASKVYLQGLDEKKDSAYIFFGGFIGQGNISKFTDDIPSDAVLTNIYMEMEIGDISGDQFMIYFNDNKCNGDLNRTSSPMQANAWDLSSCISDISSGSRNNVSIVFIPDTNFDIAYISGGLIRFDYATKQMYQAAPEGYTKYYFPSIDGLINIYTSVYIPGNITQMTIQLKYLVNHTNTSNSTFYMKVGNTTVLQDDNSTTVQTVQLDGGVLIS